MRSYFFKEKLESVKSLLIRNKKYLIICILAFIFGVILAILKNDSGEFTDFCGREINVLIINIQINKNFFTILFEEIIILLCNLLIVSLFSLSVYCAPIGIFFILVKSFSLCITLINFYKIAGLFNFFISAILLLPLELVMLLCYAFSLIFSYDIAKSNKIAKTVKFSSVLISLGIIFLIMLIIYIVSIILVYILSKSLFYNFI